MKNIGFVIFVCLVSGMIIGAIIQSRYESYLQQQEKRGLPEGDYKYCALNINGACVDTITTCDGKVEQLQRKGEWKLTRIKEVCGDDKPEPKQLDVKTIYEYPAGHATEPILVQEPKQEPTCDNAHRGMQYDKIFVCMKTENGYKWEDVSKLKAEDQ